MIIFALFFGFILFDTGYRIGKYRSYKLIINNWPDLEPRIKMALYEDGPFLKENNE
jgi:hypothetical protein